MAVAENCTNMLPLEVREGPCSSSYSTGGCGAEDDDDGFDGGDRTLGFLLRELRRGAEACG